MEQCKSCGMPVLQPGDKLVVFDRMFEGEPDEYLVVQDGAGNLWRMEPEWLHKMEPENG
jgi:hypothetical protein